MSSAPLRSQAALIAAAISRLNGRTPPSPCSGSTMIAAVFSDTAASSSAGSVLDTNVTPSSSGLNGAR